MYLFLGVDYQIACLGLRLVGEGIHHQPRWTLSTVRKPWGVQRIYTIDVRDIAKQQGDLWEQDGLERSPKLLLVQRQLQKEWIFLLVKQAYQDNTLKQCLEVMVHLSERQCLDSIDPSWVQTVASSGADYGEFCMQAILMHESGTALRK